MSDSLSPRHPRGLAYALALARQQMEGRSDGVGEPRVELLIESGAANVRIGGPDNVSVRHRLAALTDWLRHIDRWTAPNATFCDTTLLVTAHALTLGTESHHYVSAPTLLDLAAFARAVVLYEHVITMPGALHVARELNAALEEDVILPLPVPLQVTPDDRLEGVSAVVANVFESAMDELHLVAWADRGDRRREDLAAIAKGWSLLLGHRVPTRMVLNRWEEQHWDSNGAGLLRSLTNAQSQTASYQVGLVEAISRRLSESNSDFISECNHRSYFNLRLAHLLQLPYTGSITRIPFRSQLYRHAAFAHQQLLLQQEIEASLYRVTKRPDVALPAYATIALHRAADTRDVITQIAELRSRAKSLRRRRSAYDRALRERDTRTVTRLRTAIESESASHVGDIVGPVSMSASSALAAAASNTTELMVGLIAALALIGSAATVSPERRAALSRRLLRPAEWFLTSTSDEARNIASVHHDIGQLWSMSDDDVRHLTRRLKALSALGPA
ncbi:hypothetical protein [Streptomyces poonensis]|uniref:Uncharacterized protein n=1 Tax=Streptomyces poonensis TaxID=68255 RepID=A0A918UEX8_9ACTN|nr:hypothetical protein [Streptomyces poonensis]GGY99388.1 hypothetical protein GCM10010365_17590 [Streptomyces poonensis]